MVMERFVSAALITTDGQTSVWCIVLLLGNNKSCLLCQGKSVVKCDRKARKGSGLTGNGKVPQYRS